MAIGSSSLSDNNDLYELQHVQITQPVGVGSTLRYDGTNFVNVPDKINTLLDANIVNPQNGDFLVRQGDYWQNLNTNSAFKLLSPQTTVGDLIAYDGNNPIRFPVGTDGQVLTSNSTKAAGLAWMSIASGRMPVMKATASEQMITNTNYIVNSSSNITLTLPDNMAFGDIVQITSYSDAGFNIVQNADQIIQIGNVQASNGSGAVVSSSLKGDSITLQCVTDSNDGGVSHLVSTNLVGNFSIRN